jgi:glycosyltransferase involved in cell wall biosynthesis
VVHASAVDLHDRYPTAADEEWLQWCGADGLRRFPILAHPLVRDRLFGHTSTPKAQVSDGSPVGVNLIGHAGTRSGVGEDLRMAALALEAAKIPFVVRKVEPSTGIGSNKDELNARLVEHSPFSINMFCMAGMETVTMLSKRRNLLEGKFNIGFWPWELSQWPKLWSHGPGLMDELWASTSFTASAYRQSSSVPVRQVPMAVEVDATEGLERLDFGLPQDRFLFAFSFDGHSSFGRKNPEGVVRAFQMAFPSRDETVGLILKGLRVSDHPAWCHLESLAAEDPRISLIADSMSRGRLLDLYRAIDCFVSLHRSEGFGRNIAECMLLGKPIIATKYSGNVDFTTDATAAMVDASLKPIGHGEYPFGAGQFWADPELEQAADHMRRISSDETWRSKIARSGRTFINSHHSPTVVGERFRQELNRVIKNTSRGTHGGYF